MCIRVFLNVAECNRTKTTTTHQRKCLLDFVWRQERMKEMKNERKNATINSKWRNNNLRKCSSCSRSLLKLHTQLTTTCTQTQINWVSVCECVYVWIFEWLFINSRVSTSNWACHFCIAAASSSSGFVLNVCLPWLMDHFLRLRLKLTFSYELV